MWRQWLAICLLVGLAQAGPHVQSDAQEARVRLFVLDIDGDGVRLTNPAGGIMFDMDSTEQPVRTAWTAAGQDDSFVVIDPKAGPAVRGDQLLGTGMRMPDGRRILGPDKAMLALQGYQLALDWSRPNRSPQDDVVLNARDLVFATLRLWADRNHDGRAQAGELRPLMAAQIDSMGSSFRVGKSTDSMGNVLGPLGHFYREINGQLILHRAEVVEFAR